MPERRETLIDSQELVTARLAAIVESSDDAIVSKTLDGTILTWNPAAERVFGYSAQEMVGSTIFRLVPEHARDEEEDILQRISRGEHVAHYETERVRKDGKLIVISLTVSPVRDSTGRIVAAASIKRDITEQKKAEQTLRQTAKMEAIGRLAGGLAHDFNNQLHAMSGFIHFIERDKQLSAAARQDLLQVQKSADRMSSLTRQLLAFARQQVLTPETLDLDVTVAETRLLLQRLIGTNIEITLRTSPGPKWVRVDRAQLVQVVLNLVINARDAMPAGGLLTITSETLEVGPVQMLDRSGNPVEPGAYAQLTVTDTGAGIPIDQLNRIFEPFFTTKEVGHGTGLGLATVEGIVSQSGGYITIDSRFGQGTSITVLFPITAAPIGEFDSREPESREVPPFSRILVVDDDEHVRTVVARLLRGEGYDVVEASHGQEALEVIEQAGGGLDLVITDLVMPVMGGRDFLAEVARRYSNIPSILISGHPQEPEFPDQKPEAERPFLQKPVPPALLLNTVLQTLRSRK